MLTSLSRAAQRFESMSENFFKNFVENLSKTCCIKIFNAYK